jgi:hypothetical protein
MFFDPPQALLLANYLTAQVSESSVPALLNVLEK